MISLDSGELKRLLRFLKRAPGRLVAVEVPGRFGGDAVIASLRRELGGDLPVEVAAEGAAPFDLGSRATELGGLEEGAVFVVPIDGRRQFASQDARVEHWQKLNYQRERLAFGTVRTVFLVTPEARRLFAQIADDLWDWTMVFHFPDALPPEEASRLGTLELQQPPFAEGPLPSEEEIKSLREQFHRAREAGVSEARLARDYARPLFLALARAERDEEAARLWERELLSGGVFKALPSEQRMEAWSATIALGARDRGSAQKAALLDRGLAAAEEIVEQFREKASSAENGEEWKKRLADLLLQYGYLQLWIDDLDGARASYESALPIYREIRARLGEANCLQGLGDLQMRVDDLDGARASYESALPIYREIRDRLGEANCLQSLGLFELARWNPQGAFQRFLAVLEVYQDLRFAVGVQSASGYLARTAAAAGMGDQALVLADHSLEIGRKIQDRFGQTINLELQIQVLRANDQRAPALAAMRLIVEIAREIRADATAEHYTPILEQGLSSLPAELRTAIEENAEDVRRQAIAEAAERLEKAGRDPFDPPTADA